jgi:CRISPR-associated endonuclease/helicase Cas3
MEQKLHSSELYSHPDKFLENHLVGVARFADVFLSEKPQPIYDRIHRIVHFSAICHDLGKATKFFQEYITSPDEVRIKTEYSQHSLLSAFMGLYEAKKYLDKFDSSLVFLAIKHHHGNLNFTVYDFTLDDKDIDLILKQIESINPEKFAILIQNINQSGFKLNFNLEHFKTWVNSDLINLVKDLKRTHKDLESSVSNYFLLNIIYSILLDADKSDVVVRNEQIYSLREKLPTNLVDKYKASASFQTSSINLLREEAYREILSQNIDTNQRIYSLNLPTGLGKTFASLAFALKLREEVGNRHRIIYSLPFLSIIDQNSSEFEKVLKANEIEPKSNILLKHHHLSDIRYEHSKVTSESESDPVSGTDWARILVEGWNSEIIVTTFVQFFHTLVSHHNRSLRKFHRLANSIIILDEVQSIPIKYWQLTRKLLLELTQRLNSYVIFVTATQPMIFEPNEIVPLCNHKPYFETLNRISIIPRIQTTTTIDELAHQFDLNEKTHLFIFNTINSAETFYKNLIKQELVSNSDVAFLSTHIVPKHRKKRIKEIKEDKKYKIVVSTQLVEAGVDIDFDVVVRDIAPLDSIIQSAGRCNRNASNKGEVYVVNIVKNGKRVANYIYDPVLLDITESILKGKTRIDEPEILELANQYFQETSQRKSTRDSTEILDAIASLVYDHPDEDKVKIKDFNLIEKGRPEIDVFIEVDDDAKEIWQRFIALKEIKDRFERKNEFDKFKSEFYDYVISIPRYAQNQPILEYEIGYVSSDMLKICYDISTGYILKEENPTLMF